MLYRNKPWKIVMENTNACNAKCIFCPHKKMKRVIGIMSFSLYKKIIDECVDLGVTNISLYRIGEPFLDPFFIKKISYVKKKGVKFVSTCTNASLLTLNSIHDLLNSGLDEIEISIDGNSKYVYESIRVGLHFSLVKKNIQTLINLKKEGGFSKPIIKLNFVKTEINQSEIKSFLNEWRNDVDRIQISELHNWGDSLFNFDISEPHKNKSTNIFPCRALWTELCISWNGVVSLCSVDFEDNIIISNINEESIKKTWQNKRLHLLRMNYDKIPQCKSCTSPLSWLIY